MINRAVFTADFRCSRNKYNCPDPNQGCDNQEVWQGVRVEGNASNHSQSSTYQATFVMSSGSMIEYAKTGIRVGHETDSDYGGGKITIRNSYIKDNITGIQFDPFYRTSGGVEVYNLSNIEATSFTTTNDWLENYLPNAHVIINESSGISLNGNEYANYNTTYGFYTSHRGIGVKMTNSRVSIGYGCANSTEPCSFENPVRSEFNGLYYGIYGLNGTTTRTLYCNYNIFNNTYFGAFLSGFINAEVLDNEFNVAAAHSSIGLYLLGSTGYYIQNNTFTTLGTQEFMNIGIIVSDSGEEDNEIYRNTFSKLFFGGYVINVNADPSCNDVGLKWICNKFNQPIRAADIYLNGTMNARQGLCSVRPAGNLFSLSSQLGGMYGNHKDLGATLNSTQDIIYSHHDISLSPVRVKPHVYNVLHYQPAECITKAYSSNSCPVIKSGLPPTISYPPGLQGNSPSFASVSAQATEFAEQITAISPGASDAFDTAESTEEILQLRMEHNEFWHEITSFYMADTTGAISEEEMKQLVSAYQPKNVQRFASVLLSDENQNWIQTGNGVNASELAAAVLPSMVEDELPSNIPEWFESDFFSTASNVAALNGLYIANEAIYIPYFSLPEMNSTDSKSNKSDKDIIADNPKNKLVVHPNPFNTSTTFDLSAYQFEGDNNRIVFYDLLGKKVFETPISEKQINLIVQSADLPSGIVIYKLYLNNREVETGKIISVK